MLAALLFAVAVLLSPSYSQTANYEFAEHLVSYVFAPDTCRPSTTSDTVPELELRLPTRSFVCRGATIEFRDIRLSGLPARVTGTPKRAGGQVNTLDLSAVITPQLSGSALALAPSGVQPNLQAALTAPMTGAADCGYRPVGGGAFGGSRSIPADYACARSLLNIGLTAPGLLVADTNFAVTLDWGNNERVSFSIAVQSTYRPAGASPPKPPVVKPPAPSNFRIEGLGCSGIPSETGQPNLVVCTTRIIDPPTADPSTYEWYIDGVRIPGASTHNLRQPGVPGGEHRVTVIAINGGRRTPAYTGPVVVTGTDPPVQPPVVKPPIVTPPVTPPAKPARPTQVLVPNQGRTITFPSGQTVDLVTYCGTLSMLLATMDFYSREAQIFILLYTLHCRDFSSNTPPKATVKAKLNKGAARLAPAEDGVEFELATPSATITTQGKAAYRVTVEEGGGTQVNMEQGSASVVSQGATRTLAAGDSARFSTAPKVGCYGPRRTEVNQSGGQWTFDLPNGTATYGSGADSATFNWTVPASFCAQDNELKGNLVVRGQFDAELRFRSVPPILLYPRDWSARAGALETGPIRGSGLIGKVQLTSAGNEWRFHVLLSARKGEHQATVTIWYAK